MKSYRIENWSLVQCPAGHMHVQGEIYGNPLYTDGTNVMSSRVTCIDNENHVAQTEMTGLLRLGEVSERMKRKIAKMQQDPELSKTFGHTPQLLQDDFALFNPDEWGESDNHAEMDKAKAAFDELVGRLFGMKKGPMH